MAEPQNPPTAGPRPFEIGILTFAELTRDPVSGALPSPRQRARETVERKKLTC